MTSRAVMRRGLGVLGQAVREEPRVFAIAVGASAVYGAMTVASAWVLGRVTDELIVPAFRTGHTTSGALLAAFGAIFAIALLKALGVAGRRFWAGVMQYRLQATFRRRVTRQYLRLPIAWHQRHPTGQLLSNANADVEATWYPIAPLPMAVGVVVMLVIAMGAMIATDPVLASVGFLIFPAIFVLNFAYQRRLSPIATRAQQLRAEVSGVAHESFDGAVVVKTLGREPEETARFRAVSERLRDSQISVGRVRGVFDPLMEALPNLGILAVLLLGVQRIDSGVLEAGRVLQIAYLFTLIALPVRAIGWVLGELPRSVVGWDRVQHVLTATGGLTYGQSPLPAAGPAAALELSSVSFSHDDADVLHEVSFRAEAGRTVALVGPTGSGKSTLTSLLVRLVDPRSGDVRVDEVDLREVPRGGVAAAVAVVPQHTFLFDDTVRDNVTLGGDFGDDEVWTALRLAQADRFVRELPKGIETRVGERGTTLSGGQRQRIALARALVRRPRLLVLDDATSSVDPKVEAAILAGLRNAASTVVVVAYRRATIALADEVVYIEHGRVVDQGSHAELMSRAPGYQQLLTAYEREESERVATAEGGDDEEDVA